MRMRRGGLTQSSHPACRRWAPGRSVRRRRWLCRYTAAAGAQPAKYKYAKGRTNRRRGGSIYPA
eukprot:309215-Pyramimonas_sp.AAC.1